MASTTRVANNARGLKVGDVVEYTALVGDDWGHPDIGTITSIESDTSREYWAYFIAHDQVCYFTDHDIEIGRVRLTCPT